MDGFSEDEGNDVFTTTEATTTVPTTTEETTTTEIVTTTKSPTSGVQLDVSVQDLESRGFQKYFEVSFGEGRIKRKLLSVGAGSEVFVGCFNKKESTEMIRVGVFGESEDLFRQTFVAETTETDASEHNGVFTYFSKNIPGEPFGFSASPKIYLNPYDYFDCFEKSGRWDCGQGDLEATRMSIYTNFPFSNGQRCGKDTAANYGSLADFKKDFVLVAWMRK